MTNVHFRCLALLVFCVLASTYTLGRESAIDKLRSMNRGNTSHVSSTIPAKNPSFGTVITRASHTIVDEHREEVVMMHEHLRRFHVMLRSYTSEGNFNEARFVSHRAELGVVLSCLCRRVHEMSPPVSLLRSLEFLKSMHRYMLYAAETSAFINTIDTKSHVVQSILRLNVRLLALFNIHGEPDTDFPRLSSKVTLLSIICNFLAMSYGNLTDVPATVASIFEPQLAEAEHLLKILRTGMNESTVTIL